jgi:flagellar motor protein MotB
VERTAKKATSKARALWVATKLNFKGLPTERLSSTGMADEELLEDVAPDDKKQKRIVVRLTKVQE